MIAAPIMQSAIGEPPADSNRVCASDELRNHPITSRIRGRIFQIRGPGHCPLSIASYLPHGLQHDTASIMPPSPQNRRTGKDTLKYDW
ncbi:hypothetical protein CCMA1212_006537 [Trichoderma ghanense]|uniref:Uncharacterized protein n=1 Tax=Trichoderma ghanense TaxID=65468 RepID=A0ABY2H1E4_9HYPO